MKVAMMQPTFLPWQGFFALICACDRFVFGDDYHYSAGSFHQRNRLFRNRGRSGVDDRAHAEETLRGLAVQRGPDRRRSSLAAADVETDPQYLPLDAVLWPRRSAVEPWLLTPANSLAEQNIALYPPGLRTDGAAAGVPAQLAAARRFDAVAARASTCSSGAKPASTSAPAVRSAT